MYQFRCPHCRTRLGQKTETSVGREKSCPKCEARFQVPPPGKKAVLIAPGTTPRVAASTETPSRERPRTTGSTPTRRPTAARPAQPARRTASSKRSSTAGPPQRSPRPGPSPSSASASSASTPDRSEESSLFELADDFSDLEGLDDLDGGSLAAPAALPPKKKKKAAEPLRPKKHVEDYHVVETAEDRMARVGTTVLHAENVLARRITMIVVGSILLFVGARVLRSCLLYLTVEGQMQLMQEELLDQVVAEMTEADWEELREELEIDYGKKWTDEHFDELKERMLDGDYPSDDFFPDEFDHSLDPDDFDDGSGPTEDVFDADF